ncbi:MAG: hypothetical protein RJA44_689 [Pseudomonadota bacterium]
MPELLFPDALPPCRVGAVQLLATDDAQTRREKLARIVLDEMYQFVGLLDVEGCTLEINRTALDGAGIRLDDIRGRPFWQARWFQVSRESVEQQRDFVRRAGAGEFIRCDLEIYGEARGDRTIVVDFSLLPVRDADGRIVCLLAEGRNITAKKRAEAEVARKNAELQSLLDRVRQLDQLRSDLYANVSHELRTPLALILGPAEELLASGANLTAGQRRSLQVIQRNATVLLRQVNDLLDLARLDAHKMDLQLGRVDLAALVRQLAAQFEVLAPQRELSYAITTPESLPAVLDQDQIGRVLLNLLSNAFKFTPPGGRVRCALEPIDTTRCLLTVQDSGPGVPAELRQSVFERFRQAQQGTRRDFGGSGLGLAIARELVELHHGVIGVTDAPGGGALFQVELPLQPPIDAGPRSEAPPDAPPQLGRSADGLIAELQPASADAWEPDDAATDDPTERRPAVLVVEDNAEMRRFVRDALAVDCRVTAVADGLAGLARAVAQPPDLIVTDLMLPGLGGDQMVERMRAHGSLGTVPVLSARDDESLRAGLLSGSVQDYVTKPFSARELRARVRNLIGMKRSRDALRRTLVSQRHDLTHLTQQMISNRYALRESEYRWQAIYEHSPVGIALADVNGRIRTANQAFRSMLGYSTDEIETRTLMRVTPVEDRAAMQRRIEQLVAGEVNEYHLQRRFQRQDGALVWANTSVSLILGTSDATRLLVVIAEDITEQKRAEQALARTRSELARVTRASTLGELAASIAHEVNQPLAAIVANGHASLRWLDARPPNEAEARAAVQRIIRDANRASEVITRIRGFLRRGELQRVPVELNGVIGDALALVRAEAQARQITLDQSLDPGLPTLTADRVQLQQVVLNLVMNALESISRLPPGRSRQLDLVTQRHDRDTVRVDVRDSGVGIDPAIRDSLFEAFHTTRPDGMGMGLAISRSIVEAHGGRLWLSPNDAGSGVTFSFTLPLDAPPQAAPQLPESPA